MVQESDDRREKKKGGNIRGRTATGFWLWGVILEVGQRVDKG